ncbi:MAG: protoporphyrinogen oxidase [Planctomycetota bacterium]|nr:protoporphyrinogen oxidase [Planctomycetota bacterium]
MSDPSTKMKRVAVIGGGITGLAAAHRIQELDPQVEVVLVESSDRLGGAIQTVQCDQFLVERGPDMFTTKDDDALNLCRRLGCDSELIETNTSHRRAFVVRRNRLYPVPAGFTLLSPSRVLPLLFTGLLSPLGKLRVLAEYWVSTRRETSDESLASFTRRRFGNEMFERIVQPLVGGIYTADPEKLSMQATLAQFVEMEQVHGGLIRGGRRARQAAKTQADESGARYGMFLTLRNGLSDLVDRLAQQLPAGSIHLDTSVTRVTGNEHDGWVLDLAAGNQMGQAQVACDGVIVATPVHVAARLLATVDEPLSSQLGQVQAASSAVVISGYRREAIGHPLDGFGLVVPAREKRSILAASFSSVKFAGRAPEGHVLVRTFVGGARQPEILRKDDDEIQSLVHHELAELIGVREGPMINEVVRWDNAMPQYHLQHLDRVAEIEHGCARYPGLEIAGNGLRGVGIPQCIRSGESAAGRLIDAWL